VARAAEELFGVDLPKQGSVAHKKGKQPAKGVLGKD